MFAPRSLIAILSLSIHACVLPSAAHHKTSNVRGEESNAAPHTASVTEDVRVEEILRVLENNYVYPERVKNAEQEIRDRSASFTALDDHAYVSAMRSVLSELVRDRHLLLDHSAKPSPENKKDEISKPDPAAKARMEEFARRVNYGFTQVKLLDGNIGYLQVDGFMPVEVAGAALESAMDQLRGTRALVIDLRESDKGGEPEMVALITAYLVADTGRLLTRTVYRDGTEEESRIPQIDVAKRYANNAPVYVLTSQKTFSAGEELAYNLKALGRARVIGEPTGGGANPGSVYRINDHLRLFVPEGEVFSAMTGGNWNWTGVIPHEHCESDEALNRALEQIGIK